MLYTIQAVLDLTDPFDACIWAMCTCAFFGLMRFSEVTVKSSSSFSPRFHPTRADAQFRVDLDGRTYGKITLPSAKTATPGEKQDIFLVEESKQLCPLRALNNMALITPVAASDPLFSWRDRKGHIRPISRKAALDKINTILRSNGFGTSFGHSFRIGGASFYLAQGVNSDIVRIAGRWKSLVFQLYIRSFEQIASRYLARLT